MPGPGSSALGDRGRPNTIPSPPAKDTCVVIPGTREYDQKKALKM